jgi:hypothetical protein
MFTPQSSELGGDLTDKTTKKQPDRANRAPDEAGKLKDRIGNGTAFPKSSLLGNGGLRVGRDGRIRNGAAQEVKGLLERAVVLFLGRHVGVVLAKIAPWPRSSTRLKTSRLVFVVVADPVSSGLVESLARILAATSPAFSTWKATAVVGDFLFANLDRSKRLAPQCLIGRVGDQITKRKNRDAFFGRSRRSCARLRRRSSSAMARPQSSHADLENWTFNAVFRFQPAVQSPKPAPAAFNPATMRLTSARCTRLRALSLADEPLG